MSVLKTQPYEYIIFESLEKYANRGAVDEEIRAMTNALSEIHKVISKFTREEQQDILAAANILIGNKK